MAGDCTKLGRKLPCTGPTGIQSLIPYLPELNIVILDDRGRVSSKHHWV